ncbi:putative F-box protein [Cardamine amara subsp. amara]|uniref:F-box protein n=1 Tax=Cardamine amara subsp. amara TaxID=228776 RepID=A0ABD1B1T3_CARAN
MKRRDGANDRFCSSGSMLHPISLDLKLTRLPAKFLVKPHQKKLLFHGGGKELEDDEKVRSKVNLIPIDLEVEILTRLPAKSLMKFRCVSKMWSSIIRSQRFVDSYSAMSSTMRSQFIITFGCVYADNDAKRLFIFSSSYENEDSSSLVVNLDIKITPVFLSKCYSKGSSVHGFVGCPNGSQFIVCNPNTGQVITLPTKRCPTYLGYDPVENQFKTFDRVRNHISFQEYEDTTLGGKESP